MIIVDLKLNFLKKVILVILFPVIELEYKANELNVNEAKNCHIVWKVNVMDVKFIEVQTM